jgi:hypothetical protein
MVFSLKVGLQMVQNAIAILALWGNNVATGRKSSDAARRYVLILNKIGNELVLFL